MKNINSLEDYQKSIDKLKKKNFFSKLKNKCPSDKKKNNGYYQRIEY